MSFSAGQISRRLISTWLYSDQPIASVDIHQVMENPKGLPELLHNLKQVVCVKEQDVDGIFMESDHPVSATMRAEVSARLDEIERVHKVSILYACESGSRGWGFASPDSDYDVRFIYVHRLPWYLQVNPARDVIEEAISGDLDVNGWDLRKALALLKKGNATLIEWLNSPVVYRKDVLFLERLREAARLTYQPDRSFHHYVHMARNNYREYLLGETVRLKKYLYVLRPLLATLWVEQGHGVVPMRFQELVEKLVATSELRAAIDELLVHKRAAKESEYGRPWPVINRFIDTELSRLEAASQRPHRTIDFSVLDHLLRDMVLRQAPNGEY